MRHYLITSSKAKYFARTNVYITNSTKESMFSVQTALLSIAYWARVSRKWVLSRMQYYWMVLPMPWQ